jgi:hypothetical protein
MNLTSLSGAGFWLGALALAGALFALQRLRVRHREVTVVTTLFWRDALEETRARTLMERFRHPLAYLLALLVALLGWLSFGAPIADRDDGSDHLFVLDVSAPMAVGERFEDATRALLDEVRRTDRAHRHVVACGSRLETLLAPGEDELLLQERLAAVEPEACAPGVERALLVLARRTVDDPLLVVHLLGDAPVRPEVLALLGERTRVERILSAGSDGGSQRAAAAIVDVACGPSASGLDRVDVWARTVGGRTDLVLVDGADRRTPTTVATADGRTRFTFEDLVGDGRAVTVEFEGPGAEPLRGRAEVVLPDRRALRVATVADLPTGLEMALRSNAGVEFVDPSSAEVVVRYVGDDFGGGLPALELSTADGDDEAFVLVHESDAADPRSLLFEALGDLGLEWIDGEELAFATGRTIELGERAGPVRAFRLWAELCDSGGAFARDAAFPLVVARSLEWLSGRADPRWIVRAGDPLPDVRTAFEPNGAESTAALDPVGGQLVPPRAGLYRSDDGAVLIAAGPAARPTDDAVTSRDAAAPPSDAFDLANLLLLLLAGLFVVEWNLVRRGRMP